MRLRNDAKQIRLYVFIAGIPFHLDVSLVGENINFEKAKKFEDKSIFKYGARFIKQHEFLEKFLLRQEKLNSKFAFPHSDPRTICILNTEEEVKFF